MNSVVYVPLVASLLAAAVIRLGSRRVWPRAAMWAITVCSAALAISSVGALVVLASPLLAELPPVADAGRWRPEAVASHSPVPLVVSSLALLALAVLVWRFVREAADLVVEVRQAARITSASTAEVVIVEDSALQAHAVGIGVTGRGAILVSSSMLALLDDDERAAAIAHERSHLRQRHTIFSAVVRLAVAADPLLVSVRRDLRFALERAADEGAAVGADRNAVARALAKTALAAIDHRAPATAFAFHRHDVADRVTALLDEPDRRTRPAWLLVAMAAAAGLAFTLATHDTERFFEAVRLWSHR